MRTISSSLHGCRVWPFALGAALLAACSVNPASEVVESRSTRQPAEDAAQAVAGSKPEPKPDAEVLQARSANVPCPSQDFEEFLKVFANRGDVRLAYTAQPWKVVIPYYWSHDNMPGDPRFPKWEEKMLQGAADSKIAFDDSRNAYVSVESAVAPGEVWRPDDQRNQSSRALDNFTIKKVSIDRHEVQIGHGIIDVYEYRNGCWFYTEGWDRSEESVVNCKWPDECRGILERED